MTDPHARRRPRLDQSPSGGELGRRGGCARVRTQRCVIEGEAANRAPSSSPAMLFASGDTACDGQSPGGERGISVESCRT
ncbi:hypothetical protein WOLCODRAFT_27123 [Wolfiporia cocos MD-104 SS10]|uniref:Uncharacterized protein n=1 Tax=Wolfiporia cocos (strain MD-104) TaxID=742152 RepID=A0A2H3JRU4_WOLCO|nr:hypothetical protein WOLCODRAFT_27123 [Wolfiporia cocos MD-104 SS10]